MSEQNTVVDQVDEPIVEDKPIEKVVELSPIEQKAIEMGWRPKEDFDGDEVDFIDAQEFVRRKPLFDKIDSVGRELKETRKALKALQAHHERVKEASYAEALNTLKAEKKAALEEGDADKLIAVDEQIADIKEQQRAAISETKAQAAEPHPNFVKWVSDNQWYSSDATLRGAADLIGIEYAANHPDVHPDDVLKEVSRQIRKRFPERFQNPNKTRTSSVEGSSSNKPAGKATTSDDDDIVLTDEERRAMNTFVRQGILTKEQYIADIRKLRGQ